MASVTGDATKAKKVKKVKTVESVAPVEPVEDDHSRKAKALRKRIERFSNFEQYRGNTSFFDLNEEWMNLVGEYYKRSPGREVLQQH